MASALSARRGRDAARPRRRSRALWAGCGAVGLLVLVGVLFAANWVYQVARKPSELAGLFGLHLAKTPYSTWEAYAPLFERHATAVITPPLLAALAQVESQGNPLARTYWRWRWSRNPFEVYAPASSAVGMFQITDGTFEEARRYCIRGGEVRTVGPWWDLEACWFNGLYSRLVPGHAVELTAAHLHRLVEDTLRRRRVRDASLERRQSLAAVIHLCGPQRGDAFARRGFRFARGERCGSHDLRHYVARVRTLTRHFARLADPDSVQVATR